MSQKKLSIVVGLFTLINFSFGVLPVHSGLSLKAYEEGKQTPAFKTYIHGVGVGYFWANTALEQRGVPLLYCQPTKLALGKENYTDILQREINDKKKNITPETPVEMVLLFGLMKTFPCN